jgi:hypothetical protein
MIKVMAESRGMGKTAFYQGDGISVPDLPE